MLGFGSKYLIAALAGAGAIVSIWTHGYSTGADGKVAAVTARDIHWQEQIRKANERHEREIADAIEAADSTPTIPDTANALDELCKASPTCRNR